MSRTAPQLPDTASTSNAVSLPSVAGFSDGELVYYKSGDYGTISNSAATTAPFNCTVSQGPMNGASGGTANSVGIYGGTKARSFASVLTNGNIAQVYINPSNGYPTFRIVDTNNAVVVAATVISSTYVNTAVSNISVCALSGGGFVVAWINNSGGTAQYPCYAIYTNTGSVTTSAFQDTTVGVTSNNTQVFNKVTAQPNGGYIYAYYDTSNNLNVRTYNATGTATGVWLTTATAVSSGYLYGYDVAVRSDSTFIIVWSDGTNAKYNVISATNSAITGAVTITSTIGPSSARSVSVAVLSNNTFVIGYNVTASGVYYWAFKPLPTGNVLGSEVVLPTAGVLQTAGYTTEVQEFNSGANFIFVFSDAAYNYKYVVYDISYNNLTGPGPISLYSSITPSYSGLTVIDYTGYIAIYWNQTQYNSLQMNMSYSLVSKTGYAVVPFGTSTAMVVGTATAAVSGYARSGSTPTKASFFAANTEGVNATGTISTSLSPTVIDSNVAMSVHCATYPDGRFAIGWVNNSNSSAKVNVYSQAGALLTTITLPTTVYTTNICAAIKVTVLTSNKLVVALHVGSSQPYFYIYSSAYALLSTTAGYTSVQYSSTSQNVGLCSLTNDRFAFVYSDGATGYVSYRVYDSTGTSVAGPSTVFGASSCNNVTASSSQNGFTANFYYNGGSNYVVTVTETSTNTFTSSSPVTPTGGGANGNYGSQIAVSPNGSIWGFTASSTTGPIYSNIAPGPTSPVNTGQYFELTTVSGGTSYWMTTVGMTAAGTAVVVTMDNARSPNASMYCVASNNWGQTFGVNFPSYAQSTLTGITVAATSSSSSSPQPCLTPLYGHTMVLVWKDSNNYPNFAFVNAYPWNYPISLTSGVTTSNNAITLSPNNGYVFKGVSVAAASAGGVGKVQTNGLAQLNSNYSASTAAQGFDFQQPNGTAIDGVKGTIVGRNVNLTGNN